MSGWGEVNFSRDILPVLSDKCFACHGPDTKNEKDLRLDSYAAATVDLGGYRALDPLQLSESEILKRIYDKEDPMPPLDADKQLTESERDQIHKWVLSGGEYQVHWAFEAPVKPQVATVAGVHFNPIDAFIENRLQEQGGGFSAEAGREVLARRASLILTGQPPDPASLQAYLSDKAPGAYERYVDGWINQDQFGEHQARYWLDAVRYGDTHGLHLDNRRGIFPYRDWVVRSMNENLPFDEAIRWQLAGDLLDNPSDEQLLATGFVRMNPTTSEGGAIPEEFQAKNNFDRTETFGTVFLGMTMSCARCHNHKYDPISQKEYYSLLSFFNSTTESSMDGNSYTYGPTIQVPENQISRDQWMMLEKRQARVLANIQSLLPQTDAWRTHAAQLEAPEFKQWQQSEVMESVVADISQLTWKEAKGFPGRRGELVPNPGATMWVSFEVENSRDQMIWIEVSSGPGSRVRLDGAPVDAPVPNIVDQRSMVHAMALPQGKHHIQVEIVGTGLRNNQEIRFLSPWKSLATAGAWEGIKDTEKLMLLADPYGPFFGAGESISIKELATEILSHRANFTTSLIAKELETPRKTYIMQRGEYDLPTGDPLQPDVIQIMGQMADDQPRNRLGLANWLTSNNHPLVSRVLVNQLWLRVFGDGLVRTPEDFGLQGQQPTHPQLLDWLAREFQDSGWDQKHLIRLMVTSRTFRQSSARRTDIKDPENRLWGRGPSFRLDAEVLRDIALWASGALDSHMGGEGVKPYQPHGMWLAMAHPASNTKQYFRDYNWRLYRRSLYVYWKRTSPHPMMTLFDAPSRESSCIRRSRTNTPLQSLGLFNETQRVELGRVLAARLLNENDNDSQRLESVFQMLVSRSPKENESAACLQLLAEMKNRYEMDPEAARQLVSIGDFPHQPGLDVPLQAAWTQVALTILASDLAILLY